MGVKQEVAIVEQLMQQPRIHMDMEACKSLSGGDHTAPAMTHVSGSAEVTEEDVKRMTKRPIVSKKDVGAIMSEAQLAQSIYRGEQPQEQEANTLDSDDEGIDVEEAVDKMLHYMDIVSEPIEEHAAKTGRVGEKMLGVS